MKKEITPDTITTPDYKFFYSEVDNPTVIPYQTLKEVDINKITYLPYNEYPSPTEDDYKIGEFQRYFLNKITENAYIEVKEEQYQNFKKKDNTVAWKYYTPFTISWQLTGEKEQVYQTNQKLTVLAEKQIKTNRFTTISKRKLSKILYVKTCFPVIILRIFTTK